MTSPQVLPISPLSIDQLTRDLWGSYDPLAIAALAPLAASQCYQPKFYKAPSSPDEVIAANGYAEYGMLLTPGSLICGFYLPALLATSQPPTFLVQILDTNIRNAQGNPRKFWDDPIPAYFVGNYKPTYLSASPLVPAAGQIGSFPNLLNAPYPVVGDAPFLVQFWNGATQQRVELVFGVLENVG